MRQPAPTHPSDPRGDVRRERPLPARAAFADGAERAMIELRHERYFQLRLFATAGLARIRLCDHPEIFFYFLILLNVSVIFLRDARVWETYSFHFFGDNEGSPPLHVCNQTASLLNDEDDNCAVKNPGRPTVSNIDRLAGRGRYYL